MRVTGLLAPDCAAKGLRVSQFDTGAADQTIRFSELCSLLNRLGFAERQRGGSHRIFSATGVAEIVNLQARPDGTAKPYQVRQVREMIERYQLTPLDEEGLPDAR